MQECLGNSLAVWKGSLSYKEALWSGGSTLAWRQGCWQVTPVSRPGIDIPSLLLGSMCYRQWTKMSPCTEVAMLLYSRGVTATCPVCFRDLRAEAVSWGGRGRFSTSRNWQTSLWKSALVSCCQWLCTVKCGRMETVCICMAGNVWKTQCWPSVAWDCRSFFLCEFCWISTNCFLAGGCWACSCHKISRGGTRALGKTLSWFTYPFL